MQEEVTNRTIQLAISTTKLGGRYLLRGLRKAMAEFARIEKQMAASMADAENSQDSGRKSVKELIGQGKGVLTIPVAKTELRDFEKVAEKYGVDFAITLDKSTTPPRYTVFFNAPDKAAIDSIVKEYTAITMKRKDRPSVLKRLKELIQKSKADPNKNREKQQERDR